VNPVTEKGWRARKHHQHLTVNTGNAFRSTPPSCIILLMPARRERPVRALQAATLVLVVGSLVARFSRGTVRWVGLAITMAAVVALIVLNRVGR
jgi:hypothetical protein